MRIGWVGLGKLGLPCALALAHYGGHQVRGYDVSEQASRALQTGVWPHAEEGLLGLLDHYDPPRNNAPFSFGADLGHTLHDAEVVFVAVQTPHAPGYDGSQPTPDPPRDFEYGYLVQAVRDIAAQAARQQRTRPLTVAVVSTVLPGTCARLLQPLIRPPLRLVYTPSFIAMGTTVPDFLDPEFRLVGADDDDAYKDVARVWDGLGPDRGTAPVLRTSVVSAEVIKITYNCYSDDTEVMTSEGWKLFADLTGDEQILSLDPEGHVAEWVDHRPVPAQDGHTEMVRFSSTKDDILVTPGHRMFAGSMRRKPGPLPIDGERYSFQFQLVPAAELERRGSFTFTRSVRWRGEPLAEVVVASHRIPIDVYATFMGWYLSEGCVSQLSAQSWAVVVSQSKRVNLENWEYARKAVADFCAVLEVPFAESEHGFRFYHKHVAMMLVDYGHARSKYVPETIKESPPDVIRLFLNAYLAGDGSDGRATGNMRYYATISDRMASDLGEMLVKVGHMPSYRTTFSPHSGRPCHLVYETTSKTSTRRKVERVPYDGKVYCTRLARNHVMLTRRNGKCTWQGNTFLGAKLVFANAVMEVCHDLGADVDEVTVVLGHARRRLMSTAYLSGGMGDGGGCHPRDQLAMSWLARRLGMSFDLFGTLMQARDAQTRWLAELACEWAALTRLPVVVLGKAYKAGTSLTAGSPASLFVHHLENCNPEVLAAHYDPHVDGDDRQPPWHLPAVFVIATKHEVFAELRFAQGSVVIDPWRYMPDQDSVTVVRVGRR